MKTNFFITGFTLIELLIVVAIIAILAAIAVPNFLEAQVRSKAARVVADHRSISLAVESYRTDHNKYPEGTDNPQKVPEYITDFLTPHGLQGAYYTFRTRGPSGESVGIDFHGVTTPIAYMTSIPTDPFVSQAAGFLTYCYRPAKDRGNGYIITSFGPDNDMLSPGGIGNSDSTNPFSTVSDWKSPARLGDINEKEVCLWFEGTPMVGTVEDFSRMKEFLEKLSYDPTNGSVSDGDIYRLGPQ